VDEWMTEWLNNGMLLFVTVGRATYSNVLESYTSSYYQNELWNALFQSQIL
jgi:hypothetical protein